MGKKGKSGGASSSANDDAATAKHEAKLQAVILADAFADDHNLVFKPLSLDAHFGGGGGAAPILCPLNNVVLLDYTMDFCAGAGVEECIVVCVQQAVEDHVRQKWQRGSSSSKSADNNSKSADNNNNNNNNNNINRSMNVTIVRDASLTNAGDALRELDKRNIVQSDPFLLLRGDVVTNVDLQDALRAHKERHKQDSSAIMTLLFKPVSPWNVQDDHNTINNNNSRAIYSTLRAMNEDLVVGLDTSTKVAGGAPRILVYDDHVSQSSTAVPCSFFQSSVHLDFRCDLLDCGIDICSPDVLARFSDEFDYRDIRREFVANSVAEEEEGLQSKLYAHLLRPHEYAARVQDWRTYAAVSHDLLRRWCYPIVPDNLPSGYEKQFRYVQQAARQYVYREQKLGRTKVGRSSVLQNGGMIGSHCFVGEHCVISGTVIGNHVHIADNVTLIDCHVWDGVCIEEGATVTQSILSFECVIKAGATVSKGCLIGQGCIIGTNVKLPPFSRITTVSRDAEDSDDDDEFDDFDDDEDEDEEEEGDEDDSDNNAKGAMSKQSAKISDTNSEDDNVETDHEIIGQDGRGRVWLPSVDDDDDNDDSDDDKDDEDNYQAALIAKLKDLKSRSIGFDPTSLFLERKKKQEADLVGDDFSDDDGGVGGEDVDMGMTEDGDDAFAFTSSTATALTPTAVDSSSAAITAEEPTEIVGRQAGVDVVKELKTICLEFETTSPMENLAIELNSYKFSQNATYSDCVMGATLAILELMKITKGMSDGKLVGSLKSQLEVWAPLLKRLCIGVEEEKAIIVALENAAIGGGDVGDVLSTGMSFRFFLQTLHDEEVIGEETVLTWASERRTDSVKSSEEENPKIKLFHLQPVQEFLEWLEEESEEEDEGSGEEESD